MIFVAATGHFNFLPSIDLVGATNYGLKPA